jgi:hypothetical protein
MKQENYPIARQKDIVVQQTNEEVLLYDLIDNKAYCLNETSAAIWELCDGNRSVTEMNVKLSEKMKESTSEELVWLALDQLKKEKLLTNHETITIDFNGMSRRDAIRKVGFASLIALPVILSLHTPTSASVQSVCGSNYLNGCACNDPGCTVLGGVMATLAAGMTCATNPSGEGGANCGQFGASCLCYSTGVCIGITAQVNGECR